MKVKSFEVRIEVKPDGFNGETKKFALLIPDGVTSPTLIAQALEEATKKAVIAHIEERTRPTKG